MKLTMNLGERSYDIIIKRDALKRLGALINIDRKALIVSDEGVPPQYIDTVLNQCKQGYAAIVQQGEQSKSIECFERLLGIMHKYNFSRNDVVIAVGGGVVGDLAGFAASAYMRGIDFINCPTTTLSQIDSSIGGKVGINLCDTKNIVGAFHQPRIVLIDPNCLSTLSERHYSAGLAEAVKAGLIADAELFNFFETDDAQENIEHILHRALLVKKHIVEQDERETGPRALLNLGHTIGHAIEVSGNYYHGEAVALGTLLMIDSEKLKQRTVDIFKKLNLPCELTYSGDEIFEKALHDKKATDSYIKIVRVAKEGEAYLKKVSKQELREIIGEGI